MSSAKRIKDRTRNVQLKYISRTINGPSYLSCFVQSAVHQAGRHLASIAPAMDPSIYPNGGTYHHPIAVFLVSSDASLVYYTTDGAHPGEISSYVISGELIVVEHSVTIRAVAVHRDSSFASAASSEVEATFVIHSAGQYTETITGVLLQINL